MGRPLKQPLPCRKRNGSVSISLRGQSRPAASPRIRLSANAKASSATSRESSGGFKMRMSKYSKIVCVELERGRKKLSNGRETSISGDLLCVWERKVFYCRAESPIEGRPLSAVQFFQGGDFVCVCVCGCVLLVWFGAPLPDPYQRSGRRFVRDATLLWRS